MDQQTERARMLRRHAQAIERRITTDYGGVVNDAEFEQLIGEEHGDQDPEEVQAFKNWYQLVYKHKGAEQ